MLQLLHALRQKVAMGFVGGSDLAKQQEQLGSSSVPVTTMFDFCFSENGLTAYKSGLPLASTSFINWLGEDKYKDLVKFVLHYIADLDIPIKRGTFMEFRNGMINISPIGRNASVVERNEYQKYDEEHKIRETMVGILREKFADLGLTWVLFALAFGCARLILDRFSIGGQISFDVFPNGWDKRYCLNHLEAEAKKPDGIAYTTVHFFGDKTALGGNDYELYTDPRTIGHTVKNPEDTYRQIKELFDL